MSLVRAAELELDLDVFAGPFDLLLTLILREEVDLLEVDLADVVLAYLDHLETRGELDLEVATEFLVLIAGLLELKSRLMLPRDEDDEWLELEPGEAAEELLRRMLQARRYRRAADELERRLAAEAGYRYRSAPLPRHLRRASLELAEAVYEPERLGEALRDLLLHPPPIDVDHMHVVHPRVSVAARLAHLRKLLRRGSFTFDEAVRGADRVTIATTLFALLELHKQGEATWAQREPFGEITVRGRDGASGVQGASRVRDLDRSLEALLFLSNDPVTVPELADAAACSEGEVVEGLARLRENYAEGFRGIVLREIAGGFTLATDPSTEPAARRLLARPRTPPLTPAQAETLAIVAYLQPVSRPEIARIRGVASESATATLHERGLIEEYGRSQFGAILYRTSDLFLRLFGLRSLDDLPEAAQWDPTPEEEGELRDRLVRAGEARAGHADIPAHTG